MDFRVQIVFPEVERQQEKRQQVATGFARAFTVAREHDSHISESRRFSFLKMGRNPSAWQLPARPMDFHLKPDANAPKNTRTLARPARAPRTRVTSLCT